MSYLILRNPEDETPRITASALGVGISGLTAATATYTLHSLQAELAIRGSYEQQFARNMTANIVSMMFTLCTYYFGNEAKIKPAAVIGGIPLGTVSELSHAISDRILKYRSKGGIFLAHQEGGDQTLRIVGKAWGPNRYWFLTMLDFLFLHGQASSHDMFAESLRNSPLTGASLGALPEGVVGTSPWAKIDLDDIEDGMEEKHLTFPVVTRNRVYNNMYIETYDYIESVDLGMNVVEYTLFFRKYLPATRYKFHKVTVEKKGQDELEEVYYYSEDEEDTVSKRLRQIDLMTDLGFSLAMLVYRTYIIANKNSVELNTALTFAINLNKQVMGDYHEEVPIYLQYGSVSTENDLVNLSISNKEELFAIG